jgi:D-xylose transport system ATP-binding protein
MKILSGVVRPDSGSLALDGEPLSMHGATSARRMGIESLYQDLALADTIDAVGNIFLGRELIRRRLGVVRVLDEKAMERAAKETVEKIHIRMPSVRVPVRQLSGGQRQAVALARAMYFRARLLLLDEPTAALGPKETRSFQDVIQQFLDQGATVIIVTHSLPQVMELADYVVVMRAGQAISAQPVADTSERDLLELMVGMEESHV